MSPKVPLFEPQAKTPMEGPSTFVDTIAYGMEGRQQAEILGQQGRQKAAAWGQVGEAGEKLTRLGMIGLEHSAELQKALKKAAQTTELLKLQTGYLTDLYQIKDAFAIDSDFNTKATRSQQAIKELQQKYISMTSDPEIQQDLIKSTMHVSIEVGHKIQTESTKQRKDHGVATLDSALDVFNHLYAKSSTDIEKDTILNNAQSAIQKSQSAMYIDETESVKRWKKFQSSIMETEIMGMMRQNPVETRSRLMDPKFAPGLDENTRERFMAMADRVMDRNLRKAEIAERRAMADEEKAEKKAAEKVKKDQTATFAKLAARQITGAENPLRPGEAEELLEKRQINEEGYKQLMYRESRDLEKEINEGEQYLDGLFRTRSPLESIDPINESYRARIKKELRDRVREGELPKEVLNDIEVRESVKPKSPETFPRPKFLTGDKTDLTAIKQAGQITADKFKDGLIDSKTALRELRNIKDLERSLEYHNQRKKTLKDSKGSLQ